MRANLAQILALLVLALVATGPALVGDRYHFADTEVLGVLDQLTDSGRRPLAELELGRYFYHSKDRSKITRPLNKDKYRPLADAGYVLKYYAVRNGWPYLGFAVSCTSMFLAALALWLVSRELFRDPLLNLVAPVVCVGSTVLIAQSYLMVHTEDSLLVFLSGMAVFGYQRWRRTRQARWFWLCVAFCLYGPFYKEPTQVVPPVLFLCELYDPQRCWRRLKVMAAVTLVAIYPSSIATLLLFGEWIGARFTSTWTHPRNAPYFAVVQHLVGQVAPSLVLLGLSGLAAAALRGGEERHLARTPASGDRLRAFLLGRIQALGVAVGPGLLRGAVALCAAATALTLFHDPGLPKLAPHPFVAASAWFPKPWVAAVPFVGLCCLAGASLVVRGAPATPVVFWFGASLCGLARYFFIDHHLMFVLAPFSVLLAYWLHLAAQEAEAAGGARGRQLVLGAVALLCLEAAVTSRNVFAVHAELDRVERALSEAVGPRPSRVVTNSMLPLEAHYLDRAARDPASCFEISGGARRPGEPGGPREAARPAGGEAAASDPASQPPPPEPFQALPAVHYHGQLAAVDGRAVSTLDPLLQTLQHRWGEGADFAVRLEGSQWGFWPRAEVVTRRGLLAFEPAFEIPFRVTLYYLDPLRNLWPTLFTPRPLPPDFYREFVVLPAGPFRLEYDQALIGERITAMRMPTPEDRAALEAEARRHQP